VFDKKTKGVYSRPAMVLCYSVGSSNNDRVDPVGSQHQGFSWRQHKHGQIQAFIGISVLRCQSSDQANQLIPLNFWPDSTDCWSRVRGRPDPTPPCVRRLWRLMDEKRPYKAAVCWFVRTPGAAAARGRTPVQNAMALCESGFSCDFFV